MSDEFGHRLMKARHKAGLSIAELSERSKVRKSCIYAYEAGRVEPKFAFAAALAKVLAVSLDYFAQGEVK